MATTPISVAIVDASAKSRSGLIEAFRDADSFEVVFAGDRLADVRSLRRRPTVVTVDLNLYGRQVNLKSVKELVSGGSAILAIAANEPPALARCFMDAGVLGYISRDDAPEDYLKAVHVISEGKRWLSPRLKPVLNAELQKPQLSKQEMIALQLYVSGMKLDTVAWRMGIGSATVKEYLDRVRSKYEAVGRPAPTKVDLLHHAAQDGFL